MSVDGAKLTPDFSPDVKDYTVDLPRRDAVIAFTVDPTSSNSTFTIDGAAGVPNKPNSVKLTAPKVEITVKSPDGTQSSTFTVAVNRK